MKKKRKRYKKKYRKVFVKKVVRKKIKKRKKRKINKPKKIKISKTSNRSTRIKKDKLIIKLVRFQEKIKPYFKIRFNFDLLYLDRKIQNFFTKIENKINQYKILRAEEKRKIRLEEIDRIQKEKVKIEKQKQEEENLRLQLKIKQLKDEEKLERERSKDIKLFLRKEQAILRKEQSERQRKFLQELKLEQQIEKFRIREVKELEKLEKVSLKEQREDYQGLQERIEKLKEKYRLLRDQKIRERVEALGVKVHDKDDREALLSKEREYHLARQKIEMALESFYRSANSLVFQLNKRHLTRQMSIFRCIDRRFETGEIFIRWDDASDEDWIILIYIKNNSPDEGIIIEDKSNPEKNISNEFKTTEIFKASDMMVDSLTQLLARERSKKAS